MIRHLSVSVRGNLKKTDVQLWKDWAGCITDENGEKPKNGLEVRSFFLNELSKGHEVVPSGNCDNFCFQKGCLGHKD